MASESSFLRNQKRRAAVAELLDLASREDAGFQAFLQELCDQYGAAGAAQAEPAGRRGGMAARGATVADKVISFIRGTGKEWVRSNEIQVAMGGKNQGVYALKVAGNKVESRRVPGQGRQLEWRIKP